MSTSKVSLDYLARGNGPLSTRQLRQAEQWLDADWEAADCDRRLLTLIRRLLDALSATRVALVSEYTDREVAMRTALVAVRDYEPEEIAYDEFAYKRLVEAYRRAARGGLAACSKLDGGTP